MIGIISDIHGNFVALKEVLHKLDQLGVSEIVCLGDTAGYYSQINECCVELRERNIPTIMGNHDFYLTTDGICPRSQSATECLAYQAGIIKPTHLHWLAHLPRTAVINGLALVHGGWNDPLEEYMTPSTDYFSNREGLMFASGHTHKQLMWTDGVKHYCNPGSVGQPRDGDPRSSFATFDGQRFNLHRVEYDIPAVQRLMAAVGFSPRIAANLEFGLRIGAVPEIGLSD